MGRFAIIVESEIAASICSSQWQFLMAPAARARYVLCCFIPVPPSYFAEATKDGGCGGYSIVYPASPEAWAVANWWCLR